MTDKGKTSFRSIDEWKSALMTLPDGNFFELLRSVLGNIKTPFSKQRLLEDLFNLLSRDEIRATISAYINEQDHKLIAAVALLHEPAPGDLESFFAGEFTPAELHALIINLEERLILYRFNDDGTRRLALNPVLEQVLTPFTADASPLFASGADDSGAGEDAAGDFLPESRFLAALFAFILNGEDHFKNEGGLRKKTLDDGKKVFGNLELEQAIKICLLLGLFRQEGQSLVLSRDKAAAYCDLSNVEKCEYWTAALYLCVRESDSDTNGASLEEIYEPRFSWGRLQRISSFIHRFRSLLDPARKYPEITLRRLWEFLKKENEENAWGDALFDKRPRFPFEPLLTLMEQTGLMEKTSAYWRAPPFLEGAQSGAAGETAALLEETASAAGTSVPAGENPPPEHSGGEERPERHSPEKPVLVMDAAFSFILYPGISFTDAITLGKFCAVKEHAPAAVLFELTRQSVVRGFDMGINAGEMLALLKRLSLNRLEPNLSWTLKDWENRYTGVSLHQGIVLTLAEDRRYLAEAKPLASLIQKTLAPGVYLLSSGEKSEAVRALARAGVDIVAQPPPASAKTPGNNRNSFPRLEPQGRAESPAGRFLAGAGNGGNAPPEPPEEKSGAENAAPRLPAKTPESIKQSFRETLEKMKLGKREQDELLARIERRLILTEAQLEATSLRYEKLEARGLDYVGKSAIAKQAIAASSPLEVSWPGQGGETNHTTGIAQAFEKKEGETVLVLKSGEKDDRNGRVIRIPLGKISLIRRIKQSIFGE